MTQLVAMLPTADSSWSSIALGTGLLGLTALWCMSRLTRWQLYNEVHSRYAGKYALSAADDAKGLPRMNKAGYRGVRDAQYILRMVTTRETPFLFQKALEFALFRTYGTPSIAKILLRTGNFVQSDKSSRRYADTSLLIISFLFYPLPRFDLEDNDAGHNRPDEQALFDTEDDDPRAAIALARVNFLHRRANGIHAPAGAGISNEDLLYTLSVFVTQPIAWIERFGWRRLSPLEKEALFTVMYHVGRCMKIEGVPDTLEKFDAWTEAFEQRRLVFAPQNHTVAVETVNLLLWAVPPWMRGPFFPVVASVMDDRMREAVGFNKPPAFVKLLPISLFHTAALVQRFIGLPRGTCQVVVPYSGDGSATDILMQNSGSVCPMSGKEAAPGLVCPASKANGNEEAGAQTEAVPKIRMLPKWFENDPHYSQPAPVFSSRWLYERIFVAPSQRHGAPKWQRAPKRRNGETETIKSKQIQAKEPILVGYRLEECGPRGVEDLGHDEVRAEAEQLHARPLLGQWSF